MPKLKAKVVKKSSKAAKPAKAAKSIKEKIVRPVRKSAREILREKALLESKKDDPFEEDVEKETFNSDEPVSVVEKEISEGVEEVDESEVFGTGHLEDDVQGEDEDDKEDEDY
jgi:hypothetical protein